MTSLTLGASLATARAACVIVHGRGQSPEDMAGHIAARLAVPGVHFRLPRAMSRSWYDAKAVDALTPRTETQLGMSLAQVAEDLAAAGGVPVVLAGFSQGACVVLEHVMRGGGGVAGLCVLTGCRVGTAALPVAGSLRGLPVYAACGDDDPWIPLDRFAGALYGLATGGARLRSDVFPGRGHQVSDAEIAVLAGMLGAVAAGRAAL